MLSIEQINNMHSREIAEALMKCCGSRVWVEQMILSKPFSSIEDLYSKSARVWSHLDEIDYLEAFSHHPKIGDVESIKKKYATTASWATQEQKGIEGAGEESLKGLVQGNEEYERKFGFIFLVCATGKSAPEMLNLLKTRLSNTRDTELKIAAEEQDKITRIRLEKWIKGA